MPCLDDALIGAADIGELDLFRLVELLEDMEGRRTPVGWSPADAVRKAAVERRVLELVGAASEVEPERRSSSRIPCNLEVVLRTKRRSFPACVRDIGEGGAFVATEQAVPVGARVDIEIRGLSDEHGLRARGRIAWRRRRSPRGLGICFADQPTKVHARRLRRFVLELLRHRADR